MFFLLDCAYYSCSFILMIYFYWTWKYFKWNKSGVPCVSGRFPYGNIKDIVLRRRRSYEVYDEIYRQFPEKPFVGFYRLRSPCLMIRSVNLARSIMACSSYAPNLLNPRYCKKTTFQRALESCDLLISHLDTYSGTPLKLDELMLRHAVNSMVRCMCDVELYSFENNYNESALGFLSENDQSPQSEREFWFSYFSSITRRDSLEPVVNCLIDEVKRTTGKNPPEEIWTAFQTLFKVLNGLVKELATSTNTQKELRKQIFKKLKSEIEFTESSLEVPYLDWCIKETLRRNPPTSEIERTSLTDSNKLTEGGSSVTIEKGISVLFPLYSWGCDPALFPEPELFRPESWKTNEDRSLSWLFQLTYTELVDTLVRITIVRTLPRFHAMFERNEETNAHWRPGIQLEKIIFSAKNK